MYQSILVIFGLISIASTQKLCSFTNTPNSNATVLLQHFSTAKCLSVTSFGILPQSKIVLDECSYNRKSASMEQKFYLNKSPTSKYTIKNNAGMGTQFCLTTSRDTLSNTECRQSALDQNWSLKSVRNQNGKFLLEQFSSNKCLIPKNLSSGTEITLAPCNALITEQIWKICVLK